jgi:hypothetical protein
MMTNIESDQKCIQRGFTNILETHEKKFLIINPKDMELPKESTFFFSTCSHQLPNLFSSCPKFVAMCFPTRSPNITTFYPIAQI